MRRSPKTTTLALVAAFGLLLLPAFSAASGAGPADGSSTSCESLHNIYDGTPAQLTACGFKLHPLQRVVTLSDGTKEYFYDVDGHSVFKRVPPEGFNFATASDSQLQEYGLPSRPRDAAALATWTAQMERMRVVPAGQYIVSDPRVKPAGSVTFVRWAGYEDLSSYNQFYDAYADYIEPGTVAACSGDAVVIWSGLGGWYHPNTLAQQGTAPHIPSWPADEAWWDILPDVVYAQFFYDTVSPGDDVQARTHWSASQGQFTMTVADTSAHWTDDVVYPTSNYDGRSSEFIVERPVISNQTPPLRNFGYTVFNAGQTNNIGMQNFSLYQITMQNSASPPQTLAYTDTNVGQSFDTYWKQCQ